MQVLRFAQDDTSKLASQLRSGQRVSKPAGGGGEGSGEGLEEEEAGGGAEEGFAGAVGVGHEAEDVAAFAEDARNILERSVGVGCGGDLACGGRVAEGDA